MRALSRGALAACALTLSLSGGAWAVSARELSARARAAEARRDWAAAASALEELVAAGIDSSEVLYDLGTVNARGERYGRAVWRLEQVVRRAPWNLAAQKNLRATRVRLARRDAARSGRAVVETSPSVTVQLGELVPPDVAVPLVVLAELLVGAAWWARRKTASELRRVGATVVVILAGVGALVGLGIIAARRASPPSAVVLEDGLRLLQTPRSEGIPDEPVREGERVEVGAREGEFVRVKTLAGRAGWLRSRHLGLLSE